MPKTGAPETRPVSGLALLPYTQGATGIPDFRPPRPGMAKIGGETILKIKLVILENLQNTY